MRELLRRNRVARWLRLLPFAASYRACLLLTRPKPNRLLFLSDSHAEFVGNLGWLRDALLDDRPDLEIVGIFRPSLRSRRPLRDALRLPWLLATSGVTILDDFTPGIYGIRLRPGARLIQLWHAAGAFKRVGHSRAGLPGGPPPGSETHRNYTDAFVSSEAIRDDYAEAFGIDRERVRALGVPRTDFFFDAEEVRCARERVFAGLGLISDERLVVVAPTFRGNGQLSARADASADWGRVADALGAGWRLALRQHPFSAEDAPTPVGVLDAGAPWEMNELLAAADVLVTDYSSALFEFALLCRPVVLFVPDLEEYTRSRSFYRPFEHYAIGPVVADPALLPAAIRGAEVDAARIEGFLEEFCGALDGHSSERIARDIIAPLPVGARS